MKINLIHINSIIILIFFAEIIFGGSLGFIFFGIPLRKLLILIIILIYIASLFINGNKIRNLNIIIVLTFIIAVWGLLVPLMNAVELSNAINEMMPLTALLLVFPLVQAFNYRGGEYYLNYINWGMAVISASVIFAWFFATFLEKPDYAYGILAYFSLISGENFAKFIGPMPDGSFRVMWITLMIVPFLLIYKNMYKFSLLWTLFYILAVYATGTRSFIYASVLIIVFICMRHHKNIFIYIIIPSILALSIIIMPIIEQVRVFELKSEIESDSPRLLQLLSLLKLFYMNPFFGAGFGSQADIIRAESAPYSYELTYVALLAKTGILGILFLSILIINILNKAMIRFPDKNKEVILIFICFCFITSTNPYLFNLVGISLVAFLLALVYSNYFLNIQKKSINR